MKRFLTYFTIFLAVFFMAGFADASPNSTQSGANAELVREGQNRAALINHWVNGLYTVYTQTNSKDVGAMLKTIEKHGVPAIPRKDSFNPSRTIGRDDFALIPLLEKDQMPPWKAIYDSSEYASVRYMKTESDPIQFIVLKNDELFSPGTLGEMFAHELNHSKQRLVSPDRKAFCRGEVIAHTFSNGLVLQIGGPAYQKILDERAKEFSGYLLTADGNISSIKNYSDRINAIFGNPISQQEMEVRFNFFETASIFLAVDKYYPGTDKEAEKAGLYCDTDTNKDK
jgi:hypothetical protein